MSDENRFQGQCAQHLAQALFLKYMTPAEPQPDSGDDLWLSPRDATYSSVQCRAQVKDAKRFEIRRTLLREWLEQIHKRPVFLLRVTPISINEQRYHLCILYDLLLDQARWLSENSCPPPKYTTVPSGFFKPIDEDGQALQRGIQRESKRVAERGTPWIAGGSPHVPLAPGDIPLFLGRLTSIEVPLNVIRAVEKIFPLESESMGYLRDRLRGHVDPATADDPDVREWLSRIGDASTSPDLVSIEEAEFKRFVSAVRMAEAGSLFTFASHKWTQTSRWRVFFTLFPATHRMLNQVLLDKADRFSEPQFRTALYISSAIVHSSGKAVSDNLVEKVRRIDKDRGGISANSFEDYRFLRAIAFARAQAEGGRHVKRLRTLIEAHRGTGWEAKVNTTYYSGSIGTSLEAMHTILKMPKPRDVHTLPIVEFLVDMLGRN